MYLPISKNLRIILKVTYFKNSFKGAEQTVTMLFFCVPDPLPVQIFVSTSLSANLEKFTVFRSTEQIIQVLKKMSVGFCYATQGKFMENTGVCSFC